MKRSNLKRSPLKRKSRIKKKSKLSISKLKHKLDAIYSKYRRLSQADKNGMCICITCGKRLHWTKIQNGHYIPRSISLTRYYDRNNHCQCAGCNIFGGGKPDIYAIKLIELYGNYILQELNDMRNINKQFKEWELLGMIEDYTKKFEQLQELE